MAARLRKSHQDQVRDKIRASQLVTRLTNHALGKIKRPMDSSQVAAALGLLKKCLPDLAQTALTNGAGGELFDGVEFVIRKKQVAAD